MTSSAFRTANGPLLSRRTLAGAAASLTTLLAATAVDRDPAMAQGTKLKVVATFSILEDWLRQIGGEAIDLSSIVPAGGDAHGFDPSPDQVARLADANLIFEIGLGFETWLDDMVAASGTTARRVAVSEGVAVRALSEGEDHDHAHGDIDPHIWGNVQNAIIACRTITAALGEGDLDMRAAFLQGRDAYVGQLSALDTWVKGQIAAVPADQRRIVTSHDALGYYTDAYGIEIVGTILGLSTEEAEPSARQVADLIDQIGAAHVKAIFPENVENPQLLESIAAEAGVQVGATLYTDALGEPGSNGDTYLKMIAWNTQALVAGMLGKEAPTTLEAAPDLEASPAATPEA